LDILYRGLGIGKLQFLIKKKFNFFLAVIFFQFLVIKALDPDWIRIRIRIRIDLQPLPLDPDPEKNEYGSETLLTTSVPDPEPYIFGPPGPGP
jgi:hypothetical protein